MISISHFWQTSNFVRVTALGIQCTVSKHFQEPNFHLVESLTEVEKSTKRSWCKKGHQNVLENYLKGEFWSRNTSSDFLKPFETIFIHILEGVKWTPIQHDMFKIPTNRVSNTTHRYKRCVHHFLSGSYWLTWLTTNLIALGDE